eukprot:5442337-Amphidinium_carterae.3
MGCTLSGTSIGVRRLHVATSVLLCRSLVLCETTAANANAADRFDSEVDACSGRDSFGQWQSGALHLGSPFLRLNQNRCSRNCTWAVIACLQAEPSSSSSPHALYSWVVQLQSGQTLKVAFLWPCCNCSLVSTSLRYIALAFNN